MKNKKNLMTIYKPGKALKLLGMLAITGQLIFAYASGHAANRILIPDEIKVDSLGNEHFSAPLFDGIREPANWRESWASAVGTRPHWVEMAFTSQVPVQSVTIHWHVDTTGLPASSREYMIQTRLDGDYQTILEVKDNPQAQRSIHNFDEVSTDAIRIWQPEGGGAEWRENVMWITEVELRNYQVNHDDFGTQADLTQLQEVRETVRNRTIGIYRRARPRGRGRTAAVTRPLEEMGWRTIGLDRIDERELQLCRLVVVSGRRHIPNPEKLISFVYNGGSVLLLQNSCGYGGGGALFPELWEFKGIGKGELFPVKSGHPVTLSSTEGFLPAYGEHARLRATRRGTVLVRDSEGYDVVVAGKAGRGRVVAIGNFPGFSSGGMEWSEHQARPPEGAELELLKNSINWLTEGAQPRETWRSSFALRRALRKLRDRQASVIFEDVTEEAGVAYHGYSKGVAMADINGNGLLDIFATVNRPVSWPWWNAEEEFHNRLFRNDGDWKFTEVSIETGVTDPPGIGCVFGDVNGDGNVDLFVSWMPEMGGKGRGSLYLGDGKGGFRDATDESGLSDIGTTALCMMADVNNNGLLDLYLTGFQAENKLYINLGDGKFEDQTEAYGLAGLGSAGERGYGGNPAAMMADLDNDGFVDLAVYSQNVLRIFRNINGERFEEVADYMGEGNPPIKEGTLGIAPGDINNNGRLDLYISRVNRLLRNDGNMRFTDITADSGLDTMQRNISAYGPKFVDINNSGYLDLFLATGGYDSFIFLNNGGGTFTDATATLGLDVHAVHGFNFGDLDADGDLDFYATAWAKHPFILLRNNLNDGNALTIRVRGTQSNTSGVGAKIWVYDEGADSGEQKLAGYREVRSGGGSMYSGGILQQHVGLGHGTGPYTVETLFPVSGERVTVSNIVPHQVITIVEPEGQ